VVPFGKLSQRASSGNGAANGFLCYNAPNTRPLILSEEDNYA